MILSDLSRGVINTVNNLIKIYLNEHQLAKILINIFNNFIERGC